MSWQALNSAAALPEMFISVMACFILIYRMFDTSSCPNRIPFIASVATLVIAAVLAVMAAGGAESVIAFNGAFVSDSMSKVVKVMMALVTTAVFLYGYRYNAERGYFKTEFYVLGLFGVVGMMIMASAAHLLTLYVGLELFSLSLYSMVAFYRDSKVGSEAAMKYFILGALASAVLLYAISLLYGLTGSLQLSEISNTIAGMDTKANLGLILAVVLAIVGLSFKLGLAPFHMWLPDVYQGSPTSVTAYLAAAPKIAAFAMVIRLLIDGLAPMSESWQSILILLALLSVAWGNIAAIAQTNIKRMLGYSTISHMGFFLFGIIAANSYGYGASMFYILVYAVMSAGVFGLILLRTTSSTESERIADFKGLGTKSPGMAALMMILMLSMAGIPPFAGFWAKMSVILSLVNAHHVTVAVIAVLLAVIGAFYYLRIIKTMYFDEPEDDVAEADNPLALKVLLAINVLALIVILPWINRVIELTQAAFPAG